jgi:hypothetical protein
MIMHDGGGDNTFFHDSRSFEFPMNDDNSGTAENKRLSSGVNADLPPDEYTDDDDPGFEIYEVTEENFILSCKELATRFDFPNRAVKPTLKEDPRAQYRSKVVEVEAPKEIIKNVKKDDSAIMLKKL